MIILDSYDDNPDDAFPCWVDVLGNDDYVVRRGEGHVVLSVVGTRESSNGREFQLMTMDLCDFIWVTDAEMRAEYILSTK